METLYDVIIIGSGPAGLAAGDLCQTGVSGIPGAGKRIYERRTGTEHLRSG